MFLLCKISRIYMSLHVFFLDDSKVNPTITESIKFQKSNNYEA